MCCSAVVVSYKIKQNYAVQYTIEITTLFCVLYCSSKVLNWACPLVLGLYMFVYLGLLNIDVRLRGKVWGSGHDSCFSKYGPVVAFSVSTKTRNFLTSWSNINFSRKTLHFWHRLVNRNTPSCSSFERIFNWFKQTEIWVPQAVTENTGVGIWNLVAC
jgi:hypothetical protein